jgi:hypothetical protein
MSHRVVRLADGVVAGITRNEVRSEARELQW